MLYGFLLEPSGLFRPLFFLSFIYNIRHRKFRPVNSESDYIIQFLVKIYTSFNGYYFFNDFIKSKITRYLYFKLIYKFLQSGLFQYGINQKFFYKAVRSFYYPFYWCYDIYCFFYCIS